MARMGVTEADWSQLAHEALNALELEIANQAFQRIQDFKYLELMESIANQKRMGVSDANVFIGDILAWQGKFHEAARVYRKSGRSDKAVALFTDLRLFDQAQVTKPLNLITMNIITVLSTAGTRTTRRMPYCRRIFCRNPFAERTYCQRIFCRRIFRRTDFSPNGLFAE